MRMLCRDISGEYQSLSGKLQFVVLPVHFDKLKFVGHMSISGPLLS